MEIICTELICTEIICIENEKLQRDSSVFLARLFTLMSTYLVRSTLHLAVTLEEAATGLCKPLC